MLGKKLVILFCSAALSLGLLPPVVSNASPLMSIDKSLLLQGGIKVSSSLEENQGLLIRISKEQTYYDYAYQEDVTYPLQMGDGAYTVILASPEEGKTYRVLAKEKLTLEVKKESDLFLHSIPMIRWDDSEMISQKAAELVKGLKTNREKAQAIYSFVIRNFKYDWDKAGSLEKNYIPELDQIYKDSSGICYDFASVYAGMLRSVGVPAKLLMGYYQKDTSLYHAWNQVWLEEEGRWVTVDTTHDAIRLQAGQPTEMIKEAGDYTFQKVY